MAKSSKRAIPRPAAKKTKITNPKIGPGLVEELKDEPVYQNPKAFSATHRFLQFLSRLSRDNQYVSLSATKIKEWFDTCGVKYTECLNALVAHELIEIDKQYIVHFKTRGYRLTEKGARLLYEGQMQYLKQLFKDKPLQRRIQKQQSYHRNKAKDKNTKRSLLEYINEGLMGYTFDPAAVTLIEGSTWEPLTKLKATLNLTAFTERKFVDHKINEADSRIWNEFVGMKSELRRYFSLGELHYRYVIDIRSCHPSFLAHYLVSRAKQVGWQAHHPLLPGNHQKTIVQIDADEERERSEQASNTISTPIANPPTTTTISSKSTTSKSHSIPISHYVGGNSDILPELARWNALFSDPEADPKAVLMKEIGYTREQAKAALNETINGSKRYGKFIAWLKSNFPMLFEVWDQTNKAEVGVEISAYYETVLMQDFALYKLAQQLGLHLTYEFDGCGVMCRDDDPEVLGKIQQLIAHIQARSEKEWGIRPVIVVKDVGGKAVDLRTQPQTK